MTKQFRYGNVCGDKGLVAPNNEWLIENVNSITDLEKNWDTVLDLLNELNNENTRIKQTIQEAYETERTQIGRNVLKQLLNSLE